MHQDVQSRMRDGRARQNGCGGAAPVLGDVAEEAVLDLAPFGRRKVRDADRETPRAIREIKHGTNNALLSLAG
jgi:hypothetical protein